MWPHSYPRSPSLLDLAVSNDIDFAERAAQALQEHQELFPMVEKFLEEASLLWHEGSACAMGADLVSKVQTT
jgi:hypothetical protein